jgi:hypothetical protein
MCAMKRETLSVWSATSGTRHSPNGYTLRSWRKLDFRAISAGERPFDSSHASKSRIRTVCCTSACLTAIVNCRLASADPAHPVCIPKGRQANGDGFVEAFGVDLLDTDDVATRDVHARRATAIALQHIRHLLAVSCRSTPQRHCSRAGFCLYLPVVRFVGLARARRVLD